MTSYEGLFLETGRAEEGRRLLERYGGDAVRGHARQHRRHRQPEYNTADATLWFLHAVGRHVGATGDADLAAALRRRRCDGDRRARRRAPGSGSASIPPTACSPRARPAGAHVDGRPRRRGAGDAADAGSRWSSTRCGSTALGRARPALRRPRPGRGRRRPGRARAARVVRGAVPGRDGGLLDVVDGPGGDDAAVRPNQLLAVAPAARAAARRGAGPRGPRARC